MATIFNDANAWLNSNGGLSLGLAGRDAANGLPSGAFDATHRYALGDVFIPVSPAEIVSTTLPALTLDGTANVFKRTLAASTTHEVIIPLQGAMMRLLTGDQNLAAPHGIKVKSLALAYRVNTTTITSFTTMAIRVVDLTAQATAPVNTALTSTLAGNTLTQAANQYLAISTVTTPAFVNSLDRLIYGHATIVIPGSSTVDIFGGSWRVSVALY